MTLRQPPWGTEWCQFQRAFARQMSEIKREFLRAICSRWRVFFVICAVSFILYYRGVRYGKHSYSAGSQPVEPAA